MTSNSLTSPVLVNLFSDFEAVLVHALSTHERSRRETLLFNSLSFVVWSSVFKALSIDIFFIGNSICRFPVRNHYLSCPLVGWSVARTVIEYRPSFSRSKVALVWMVPLTASMVKDLSWPLESGTKL